MLWSLCKIIIYHDHAVFLYIVPEICIVSTQLYLSKPLLVQLVDLTFFVNSSILQQDGDPFPCWTRTPELRHSFCLRVSPQQTVWLLSLLQASCSMTCPSDLLSERGVGGVDIACIGSPRDKHVRASAAHKFPHHF